MCPLKKSWTDLWMLKNVSTENSWANHWLIKRHVSTEKKLYRSLNVKKMCPLKKSCTDHWIIKRHVSTVKKLYGSLKDHCLFITDPPNPDTQHGTYEFLACSRKVVALTHLKKSYHWMLKRDMCPLQEKEAEDRRLRDEEERTRREKEEMERKNKVTP